MQGEDITLPGDRGGAGYGLDLNPDFLGGRNRGLEGPHPEKASGVSTAYDIKDLHSRLSDLNDQDLKGIPVLPAGTLLEQGATYIDLRQKKPKEIKAKGGMQAGEANWYVPKTEVDYQLWNRLIGVKNKERLGEANEGESNMDDEKMTTESSPSRSTGSAAKSAGNGATSSTGSGTTGTSSGSRALAASAEASESSTPATSKPGTSSRSRSASANRGAAETTSAATSRTGTGTGSGSTRSRKTEPAVEVGAIAAAAAGQVSEGEDQGAYYPPGTGGTGEADHGQWGKPFGGGGGGGELF